MFQQLGYTANKDMSPEDADIIWVRSNYRDYLARLGRSQALNHLPNEQLINNKGSLAETARLNPDWASFHPETYCLYIYEQMKEFFSRPRQGIWMAKPCSSSRGIGIKLFRPSASNESLRFDSHNYVVQKYIENPYLLRNRKFSIRCYWLVTSLDPLAVYLYPEGTVKLCTQDYDDTDLTAAASHLTNSFQNREAENYQAQANKLNWDRFLEQTPALDKQALIAAMAQALGTLVDDSFGAARTAPAAGHCFALLAADWVLDDSNRLWLTEVQQNFGMRADDPVKQQLLPTLLEETVELVRRAMHGRGHERAADTRFIRIR